MLVARQVDVFRAPVIHAVSALSAKQQDDWSIASLLHRCDGQTSCHTPGKALLLGQVWVSLPTSVELARNQGFAVFSTKSKDFTGKVHETTAETSGTGSIFGG